MDEQDRPNDLIIQALAETQRPDIAPDMDAEWRSLTGRVIPVPAVPSRFHVAYGLLGLAAAVILMFAVVKFPHRAQAFREFSSAAGGRATVTLRDGTRIVLGPESHLRVPEGFGAHDRVVDLDGEGYFAVVHDARHPFAVLVKNVKITDVGTEFDVRGYDDNVRVAVAHGNVLVGAGRGTARGLGGSRPRPPSPRNDLPSFQDIPLSAGDMVDVTNGVSTVTHHADIASATAWQQGRLVFDGAMLRDVIHDLDRTFDVQITLADSALGVHQVSGVFDNETIDQVLDDITSVMGAHYQRTGHAIVIRRGTASVRQGTSDGPPPVRTATLSHP